MERSKGHALLSILTLKRRWKSERLLFAVHTSLNEQFTFYHPRYNEPISSTIVHDNFDLTRLENMTIDRTICFADKQIVMWSVETWALETLRINVALRHNSTLLLHLNNRMLYRTAMHLRQVIALSINIPIPYSNGAVMPQLQSGKCSTTVQEHNFEMIYCMTSEVTITVEARRKLRNE